MTSTRQGDFVLVHLPETNWVKAKKRPVLVVSSHLHNRNCRDCVVVAVTSNVSRPPSTYEVLVDGQEQVKSGLYKTSLVKAANIFTIEQNMIIKSIGSATPGLLGKALRAVHSVFTR